MIDLLKAHQQIYEAEKEIEKTLVMTPFEFLHMSFQRFVRVSGFQVV